MHNRRPFRGTVRTGPAPHVHPWQVEWVVGNEFRCHIGRVHDENSIFYDESGEFEQSRFSANQQQSIAISSHKMSPTTLNRNITSMERHAHSQPVKTGSGQIYIKSQRGRITTTTGVVDSQLGYANWAENQVRSSSKDTYFVLHKVRDDTDKFDMWCVSVIDDDEILKSDIKIACFKYARGGSASRANLIQLWKSDVGITQMPTLEECSFPFKVTLDTLTGDYSVARGSVNNVYTTVFTGTATSGTYIIVTAEWSGNFVTAATVSASGSPPAQGAVNIMTIAIIAVQQDEDGNMTGASLSQMATSSFWVERFKCGTSTDVEYYWNSV
jgi:hypothetical protein